MSSERDWRCTACGAKWIADYDQCHCWRCGSEEIETEQAVPAPASPLAQIVAAPGFYDRARSVHDALARAGLRLERSASRQAYAGLTKEMALVAAMALDGLMEV